MPESMPEPFTVAIPDRDLADLRDRLGRTPSLAAGGATMTGQTAVVIGG